MLRELLPSLPVASLSKSTCSQHRICEGMPKSTIVIVSEIFAEFVVWCDHQFPHTSNEERQYLRQNRSSYGQSDTEPPLAAAAKADSRIGTDP